jgi:hypothetical protein
VGELESYGIVFVHGVEPHSTIKLPLVLLLFATAEIASEAQPMLLKHFDVMLSSDENERSSLAIYVLKCAALKSMGLPVTIELLFSAGAIRRLSSELKDKNFSFGSFEMLNAQNRVTKETWAQCLKMYAATGCLMMNCRGAPFADMIMLVQGGEFVILLQEKQSETAKSQELADRTVPTLSLESVQKEHAKCNVETPHLFVLITDEDFVDSPGLADNEIVLSHTEHCGAMGHLLALLRKFNHSGQEKAPIK